MFFLLTIKQQLVRSESVVLKLQLKKNFGTSALSVSTHYLNRVTTWNKAINSAVYVQLMDAILYNLAHFSLKETFSQCKF